MEYPKTENLYGRDETSHKLILGQYRRPDFGQVDRWLVTEKIDGTNIRLTLDAWETDSDDGPRVSIRGRSDAATLPKRFIEEAFDGDPAASGGLVDRMVDAWRAIDPGEVSTRMIVYGEGYGPGIQKIGVHYAAHKSLRIFDVVTFRKIEEEARYSRGLWHTWADVETVSSLLGILTVPVLGRDWTTDEVVDYVHLAACGDSQVAREESGKGFHNEAAPEGVVARTDPYLYDYRGNRVLWKLKGHDLPTSFQVECPENFE